MINHFCVCIYKNTSIPSTIIHMEYEIRTFWIGNGKTVILRNVIFWFLKVGVGCLKQRVRTRTKGRSTLAPPPPITVCKAPKSSYRIIVITLPTLTAGWKFQRDTVTERTLLWNTSKSLRVFNHSRKKNKTKKKIEDNLKFWETARAGYVYEMEVCHTKF